MTYVVVNDERLVMKVAHFQDQIFQRPANGYNYTHPFKGKED